MKKSNTLAGDKMYKKLLDNVNQMYEIIMFDGRYLENLPYMNSNETTISTETENFKECLSEIKKLKQMLEDAVN